MHALVRLDLLHSKQHVELSCFHLAENGTSPLPLCRKQAVLLLPWSAFACRHGLLVLDVKRFEHISGSTSHAVWHGFISQMFVHLIGIS